jgi:hypothetical protein
VVRPRSVSRSVLRNVTASAVGPFVSEARDQHSLAPGVKAGVNATEDVLEFDARSARDRLRWYTATKLLYAPRRPANIPDVQRNG